MCEQPLRFSVVIKIRDVPQMHGVVFEVKA